MVSVDDQGFFAMSDTKHVELTSEQCEILLRGLRYVRSSVLLEQRDPTPEDSARRAGELEDIAVLVARLNGHTQTPQTANR